MLTQLCVVVEFLLTMQIIYLMAVVEALIHCKSLGSEPEYRRPGLDTVLVWYYRPQTKVKRQL